MKYVNHIYLLWLTSFLLLACGNSEVKLTPEQRQTVDSTVIKQTEIWRKQIDDYCRDSSETLVQRLSDSLIQVRQQEIMQINQ